MRTAHDGRGIMRVSATTARIINGTDDLSEWSEEELERGARRGKDGRFRKKPVVVAKAVHDELVRRRMSKAFELLKESVYDGVALLRQVILDDEASYSDRIKATQLVLDRVMGTPQQHVSLDVLIDQPPWMKLEAAAIANVDDLRHHVGIVPSLPDADAEVVDGEVVEPEAES